METLEIICSVLSIVLAFFMGLSCSDNWRKMKSSGTLYIDNESNISPSFRLALTIPFEKLEKSKQIKLNIENVSQEIHLP